MAISNGYCTLAEAKLQVGVTDATDDTLLEIAVESASRAIDGFCRRRFFKDASASARRFRATDPDVLDVPDFWDTATLVVETDDNADGTFETTWTSSQYQVEPLNADALSKPWRQLVAVYDRRWPLGGPRANVRVTAKWGWTAVPTNVKAACMIQSSRVFKRKGSPFGVAGSAEMGEVRMLASKLDPDVRVMLDEFLLGRTGPGMAKIG